MNLKKVKKVAKHLSEFLVYHLLAVLPKRTFVPWILCHVFITLSFLETNTHIDWHTFCHDIAQWTSTNLTCHATSIQIKTRYCQPPEAPCSLRQLKQALSMPLGPALWQGSSRLPEFALWCVHSAHSVCPLCASLAPLCIWGSRSQILYVATLWLADHPAGYGNLCGFQLLFVTVFFGVHMCSTCQFSCQLAMLRLRHVGGAECVA